MKRIVLVLLLIASMALTGIPASGQAPSYLNAKPALALVETGAGTGSGFVIAPGLVATACHVVRGTAAIRVHFWTARAQAAGRQVLCDEQHDIAFIAVAVPEGTGALRFAAGPPAQGDRVWVWGYPLGTAIALEPSVASGVVSATETARGFLALDVSGAPGNSGGPVVDERGDVVGILVGSWNTEAQGSTGFKYAAAGPIAAQHLQDLDPAALTTLNGEILPEATTVRPGDGLGPINLGMTPAQVQDAVGLPPSSRDRGGWYAWETRHLAVFFDRGAAVIIYTEDPAVATAEGIRLGSGDTDLIKAYGAPMCSSVFPAAGKAALGWAYRGLLVFITGVPRQVAAMAVAPNGLTAAVCR